MQMDVDQHQELALVSPFMMLTLAQTAMQEGVSGQSLYRGLGSTLEDLQDPEQRISYRQALAMIQLALKAVPSQGVGLRVGSRNVLGTLGLLGYALSLCRTLRDAFTISARYQSTSGGIAHATFHEGPRETFVEIESQLFDNGVQVFCAEELFASLMVYGRALLGVDFSPIRVEFMHAATGHTDAYQAIFGPDIRFGCLQYRLVLSTHWLDTRLPNHHPLALRQALQLLETQSTQWHRKMDLIQAVEREIFRDLQGSSIRSIAQSLNMSDRTLRRRLTAHALTYEMLRDQVRYMRSQRLLETPGLSVERVSHELGYSDIRSFRRAFRRWTGQTPSAFRARD
ncbi:AraC family transcriptional regulator [Pseudomonas sp. N-137]|uniref:AraC family transcriptional regulator n=1 Tax=Pseudomonas sp. N-137 TaxID=3108452 RepID=UPI002ADEA6FC|nr:AraC family transcriptional regulator [Pseudomonas sp. N-137]MEA1030550.1 AraC family transcriptional regulator [Pseudomonas sp. N-137]